MGCKSQTNQATTNMPIEIDTWLNHQDGETASSETGVRSYLPPIQFKYAIDKYTTGKTWQERLDSVACNCCIRHQFNKPTVFAELGPDSPRMTPPRSPSPVPGYACGCMCRQLARVICRQHPDYLKTNPTWKVLTSMECTVIDDNN